MNHALVEANRLQKVIEDLQERRKALKLEPVSAKLLEKKKVAYADYDRVKVEYEKVGHRCRDVVHAIEVEERQKIKAFNLVDSDLEQQINLQRSLLAQALASANL